MLSLLICFFIIAGNDITIVGCLQLPPSSAEDHAAKLHLCSKFLEVFTRAKEHENIFAELSMDLLVSMREIILIDQPVGFLIVKCGC